VDKREQHRTMLKEIDAGSRSYVFYSRKLTDKQQRNCQFCGDLFLPGTQPGLDTPHGPAHWRRTLCSDECRSHRYEMRQRKLRADWIKAGSTPGVTVNTDAIRRREGFICYLCGGQTIQGYEGTDTRLRSETDHIIPLSGGGSHHPGNIRCCCARCNLEKGSKTLPQAIRISSCGDIDFDDLSLVGTAPTLEELISAWKQWVLPSIDDEWEMRGYADRSREERWTAIYRARIARLEGLLDSQPEDTKRRDATLLGYIGFSKFLKQYGRAIEAIEYVRKRLALCECSLQGADAEHWKIGCLDLASCLFDLAQLGDDPRSDLGRLYGMLSPEALRYICGAIVHMQGVAERRQAERAALIKPA
jgi:5-methylcytosine-specific restriction endonuclease McrA